MQIPQHLQRETPHAHHHRRVGAVHQSPRLQKREGRGYRLPHLPQPQIGIAQIHLTTLLPTAGVALHLLQEPPRAPIASSAPRLDAPLLRRPESPISLPSQISSRRPHNAPEARRSAKLARSQRDGESRTKGHIIAEGTPSSADFGRAVPLEGEGHGAGQEVPLLPNHQADRRAAQARQGAVPGIAILVEGMLH